LDSGSGSDVGNNLTDKDLGDSNNQGFSCSFNDVIAYDYLFKNIH